MGFAKPILVGGNPSDQSIRESVTSPLHLVGTVGRLEDGRSYRYASSVDASVLTAGQLLQSEAVGTNFVDIALPSDVAVGATSVAVTLGGNETLAQNALEGGYLVVNDGPGEGRTYRISGNAAVSAGTALTITLHPSDSIEVALTSAGTQVCVLKSPYAHLALSGGGHVHRAAGVPQLDVPAGDTEAQYFWVQTSGYVAGWDDGATAVGANLQSGVTAGQFETGDGAAQYLGTQVVVGVSGEYRPKELSIAS